MRQKKFELHIILDGDGVQGVRIVGTPEVHLQGHELYFNIKDLVVNFDNAVQARLKSGVLDEAIDGH